jgi:RNA polymerase sigma-70 factor (ECF subfamily)
MHKEEYLMNDQEAKLTKFEVLLNRDHKKILAFSFSLVSDVHKARDIAQEAMITAFKKLEEYDESRDFGKWLRGIVRMKYLEHFRHNREIPMSEELIELIDSSYARWDAAEEHAQAGETLFQVLNECVGKLNDEQRTVMEKFYYQRQKTGEIAKAENLNEATVRKRLERVRSMLKACIDRNLAAAQ